MNNSVKTVLLLGLLSGILLALGEMLGGSQGLVTAFGFAVVMNFVSYWFSDKIVLKMYRAQEVGPEHRLSVTTRRLATQANLPMPKVYVIPDASPNAFATGRNPSHAAVAATEGIMRLLDDQELEGVIAHELAHVKHRDILISSVAATVAAAIMMVARMAQFAAMFGGGSRDNREGSNPFAMIATIIFAPMAAMLVQAAISRSREFLADAGGARIAGTPLRADERPSQARDGNEADSARCQSSDLAHVHREAVFGRRAAQHVQHASSDRAADRSAHESA